LCALALASEPAPQIELPPSPDRNYTIVGQALTIRPGTVTTYLRFSSGVSVKGADFSLSADVVELDIEASEMTSGEAFSLPKVENVKERVVQDPGKVTAEMARELKLPDARFSASAIKRVGASGNVRVSAKGMSLSTSGLVSQDGGRSWATTGRCSIIRTDPVSNEKYELAADDVLYDTQTQRALAKGAVAGRFGMKDREAVEVHAEHCELDLAKGALSVAGLIHVQQGALSLSCGSLEANLKQQTISTGDKPHLDEDKNGVSLDATSLSVNLKAQTVVATGQITLKDSKRGVSLTAGKLEADLRAKSYIATGNPVVTYGGSTFKGEKITVRQDGAKTVVEVEGEQNARIDIGEVQSLKGIGKQPPK
jgi:lipopolysaccharide export system protein LptA